jgi:hypothetical protein
MKKKILSLLVSTPNGRGTFIQKINYTFQRIPARTIEMSNISKAFVVPPPSAM